MKTSTAGRALIEQREGRRLTAYRDIEGVWTIGVSHTGRMSPPPVTAGMTIGEADCDAMLASDLAPVEAAIDACVKVPLGQNEFDALTSLGFNIGVAGLKGSTVVKKLNLGDVAGAAAAFMNWCKPAVLTARRQAEKAQFLTPDALNPGTVVSARAQTLAVKAAAASSKARVTRNAGGALALGGASAAALTSRAYHTHVALWIFGIVALGAIVDELIALWHREQAKALAGNASTQAALAATLAGPVPIPPPAPKQPAATA